MIKRQKTEQSSDLLDTAPLSAEADDVIYGYYVKDGLAYHTVFDADLQGPVTESLSREDLLSSIAEDQHYLDQAGEFDLDAEEIAWHRENIETYSNLLDQIA